MSNIVGFICIVLALICLIPVLILFGAEAAYVIEGLKADDRRSEPPSDGPQLDEKSLLPEDPEYRDEPGVSRE